MFDGFGFMLGAICGVIALAAVVFIWTSLFPLFGYWVAAGFAAFLIGGFIGALTY